MNHFTNCTVEGFVTDDPAVRITKTGRKVTTFILAHNQHDQNIEEPPRVSYLYIEAWDDMEDKVILDIKKGKRVWVTGVLRQDWREDEKGKISSRIKLVANEIRIL